jgi:hypothetical protein
LRTFLHAQRDGNKTGRMKIKNQKMLMPIDAAQTNTILSRKEKSDVPLLTSDSSISRTIILPFS